MNEPKQMRIVRAKVLVTFKGEDGEVREEQVFNCLVGPDDRCEMKLENGFTRLEHDDGHDEFKPNGETTFTLKFSRLAG